VKYWCLIPVLLNDVFQVYRSCSIESYRKNQIYLKVGLLCQAVLEGTGEGMKICNEASLFAAVSIHDLLNTNQ
jgi:hypothetical protein